MALSDLFDKIESFDYDRVGKQNQPQTFEANGSVVTGNQTFGRPIETPLPIQEVMVGYGLRKTAQDFLSNDYTSGFSIDMSSTQFNFLSDESSTYVPELSFGNTTYTQGTDNITFQDNLIIQNSLDFTGFVDGTFRRQTNRISDWVNTPSNFLAEDSTAAEDFSLNTDYITAHNAVISNTINISPGRGNQYPNSFVQANISGPGPIFPFSSVTPNRIEQFAIDNFEKDNRVMLIPTDGKSGNAINGSQSLSNKKQKGFTNYIQEMSPGKNSPFIIKKIGSNYGLGDMGVDLGPSVAQNLLEGIGKVTNFLDEIGGGFVRGTPTFSGRIHREFDDVLRKGKFLLSSDGLIFGLKQFGLQVFNRTIETRIWNPVSILSNNFLHIPRHLGGLEYGALMKDPAEAVKDVAPSFLEPVIKPIFDSLFPTIGDGKSTSRAAFQVAWVNEQKESDKPTIPKKAGLTNSISNLGARIVNAVTKGLNSALSKGKLGLHNPNHYFRIGGPLDVYKGPDGSTPLKELETLANKINTPGEGTTFYEKKKDLTQRYNDYNFKTYGMIKEAADNEKSQNRYTENNGNNNSDFRETDYEPGFNGNDVIEIGGFGAGDGNPVNVSTKQKRDLVAGFHQRTSRGMFNKTKILSPDEINKTPLFTIGENGRKTIAKDFIDFYFKTRQWTGTRQDNRYLQFSAIINNINESVSPEYSEQRYLGRPDKYYTYNGVDREISLEFTLYPHSKEEMPFLMEKLNYLVGLCYPQYSSTGMMIAPQADLTIGDMYRDQPGYIQTLSINVQDNTTWEFDLFQFPKHITANLTFKYFGKHVPHQFGKHYDIPYLSPFKGSETDKPQQVGALGSQDTYVENIKKAEKPFEEKSLTRRSAGGSVTEEAVKQISSISYAKEQGQL